MKPIIFSADTLECLTQLPAKTRKTIGFQIHLLQAGMNPHKKRPLRTIGSEVNQFLVPMHHAMYYVVHYANIDGNIYILNMFLKASKQLKILELRVTKKRYIDLRNTL